jgi:hypothetical protein
MISLLHIPSYRIHVCQCQDRSCDHSNSDLKLIYNTIWRKVDVQNEARQVRTHICFDSHEPGCWTMCSTENAQIVLT